MARSPQLTERLDNLARRGAYSLLMGCGAFFAYFNDKHHWVTPPEHWRLSDLWFKPVEPVVGPFMPLLAVLLGVFFLLKSGYCFYQYAALGKHDG
jgi:hypothetical protein